MATVQCKPLPPMTEADIKRFWIKVDKRGPDECWPWMALLCRWGYGKFWIGPDRAGTTLIAHRVAFLLHHGYDPFPLLACHSCDSRYQAGDSSYRKCCNGAHLFTGTHADNMADMIAKGRAFPNDKRWQRVHPELLPRGSNHHNSILTERDVIAIRSRFASDKVSQSELAVEFRTTQANISKIILRVNWSHIP